MKCCCKKVLLQESVVARKCCYQKVLSQESVAARKCYCKKVFLRESVAARISGVTAGQDLVFGPLLNTKRNSTTHFYRHL